ncbi:hypothetical protein [Formosa algae]|nr:hypothetical protein [Formosa algae]PNW27568.1 hypothetical protein BKP44_12200 [Formosa algae]
MVAQAKQLDSINLLLEKASNSELYTYNQRFTFTIQSERLAYDLKIDSLILKSQIYLAALYEEEHMYELFLKTNSFNIRQAKRMDDLKSLANIYAIRGNYFYSRQSDSSYYYYDKAEKIYNTLNDAFNRSVMLLSIAIIQKN